MSVKGPAGAILEAERRSVRRRRREPAEVFAPLSPPRALDAQRFGRGALAIAWIACAGVLAGVVMQAPRAVTAGIA